MPSRYFLISPRQTESPHDRKPEKPRRSKETAHVPNEPLADLSADLTEDLDDAHLGSMLEKGTFGGKPAEPVLVGFDDESSFEAYEREEQIKNQENNVKHGDIKPIAAPAPSSSEKRGASNSTSPKNIPSKPGTLSRLGTSIKKSLRHGLRETRKALESKENRAQRLIGEFNDRLKGIFAAEGNATESLVPSAGELIANAGINGQELLTMQDLNDLAYIAQQKLKTIIEGNAAVKDVFTTTEERKRWKQSAPPLPLAVAQRVSALTLISRFAIDTDSINRALAEDRKRKTSL